MQEKLQIDVSSTIENKRYKGKKIPDLINALHKKIHTLHLLELPYYGETKVEVEELVQQIIHLPEAARSKENVSLLLELLRNFLVFSTNHLYFEYYQIVSFIDEHFVSISYGKELKKHSQEAFLLWTEVIACSVRYSAENEQQQKSLSVLAAFQPQMIAEIQKRYPRFESVSAMAAVIEYGDDDEVTTLIHEISACAVRILKENHREKDALHMAAFISEFFYLPHLRFESAHLLVNEILESFHLDVEKTVKGWQMNGHWTKNNVQQNLICLFYLERLQENSASQIQKAFHITNFYRYQPEMLIRQLQDWNNSATEEKHALERGIVAVAASDYTHGKKEDSFCDQTDWIGEFSKDLEKEFPQTFIPLIFEFQSATEFLRIAFQVWRHYGKKQSSFFIVQSHAHNTNINCADAIDYGDKETPQQRWNYLQSRVHRKDVTTAWSSVVRTLLKPNAPFISYGCDVGRKRSGLHKVSEKINLLFIGPKSEAQRMFVSITKRDQEPVFDVSFDGKPANYFYEGKLIEYN